MGQMVLASIMILVAGFQISDNSMGLNYNFGFGYCLECPGVHFLVSKFQPLEETMFCLRLEL